jgi:competence protein ComEA
MVVRQFLSVVVLASALVAPVAAAPPRAQAPAASVDQKININTADVGQLMTLTGVGRKVAERIVEYRKAHGPFKRPDEVRRVEGIGAALWERNRARIVVD